MYISAFWTIFNQRGKVAALRYKRLSAEMPLITPTAPRKTDDAHAKGFLAFRVSPDLKTYAGVVFTMPRELWSIFKRNRHLLHDLSDLGASVIQQWIRIRYGVSVLVMVVPHTFGGDLKFNSHLHIPVSAGGLHESSAQWIPHLRLEKGPLMRMWR
ncbi:MAG: transposase [Candidatus Sulfotelmatobacter sp.]